MRRWLLLMDKKKLLRISVPVFIALVVAGIWILKNYEKGPSDSAVPNNEEVFALETTAIDLEALKSYGLPIIIDFGSDSCIPCRQMAPALKTINKEMQGKAIIKYIDVWKYTDAANGFPIQVIPTQMFINADGTPYVPGDDIKIDFTMYSRKDSGQHVFTIHQGGLTVEQMRAILADMGVSE